MAIWIIALLVIVCVFSALATLVLPKLFLHNKCAVSGSADRGVRRTVGKDGESCLYEPSPSQRKYIKQYVLSRRNGQKVLVCKLNKKLEYIDYDVVVFDSSDSVRRILNVKEALTDKGYTRVIQLPDDTAYVSLNINEADGEVFANKVLSRVSFVKVLIFALCSALIVALAVMGIKVCCSYIFGGLFRESLLFNKKSIVSTVIIGAIVAGLDVALTLVFVLIRNFKSAQKKERKR